jgi:hypothetical protein
VFLWKSCYVRRSWDAFQYLSAYCQGCMGACGYIISWQALNVAASQCLARVALPNTEKTPGHD